MPPKGVYVALYSLYYTSDDFRDRNGDEVNSVTIRERSIELDVDLACWAIASGK
jgi:hypothetical protein